MKSKIITVIIVVVVLAALGYKLAVNAELAKNKAYIPDASKSVIVKAYTVEEKELKYNFEYSGRFIANREVMLIPQAQGEVKQVFFNEGDQVSQGKVLLQVDDELLQSQHMAAKANYENAKTNYERFNKASSSEGISKMQVDGAYLALKSAESQMRQLEIAIRKSKLTAPFSGTITMRDVEPGAVVGGVPVARLTDVSSLKLEVKVPESDIIYFSEGAEVSVHNELFKDTRFSGKIDFVSDRGDESHNYVVKVRVMNNSKVKLKAGMFGSISLNKKMDVKSLLIPRSALLGSAKKPQVYVVENGKSMLREVTPGRSNTTEIEVLSGLKAGESVVVSGQINLVDGSNVQVAK